jgi:hypothetical protein
MSLATAIINTRDIPDTIKLLEEHLPSIFLSKCFNEGNLPFVKEAEQTEIGHLFEHILLEYLCALKKERGVAKHVHNGVTHWNWEEDAWGVFHITVDSGNSDKEIFEEAVNLSIQLILTIFNSANNEMKSPALINSYR